MKTNGNRKMGKIAGGGDSWYYVWEGCQILGSAHEDDPKGMKHLRKLMAEDQTPDKTYWFYYGNRIIGHGRGKNKKEAHQNAIRAAELIDRTNLPHLKGGSFGRLTVKEG